MIREVIFLDTRKRLLRRPVSTAVWLVVIMLAALILGTAASIYASAKSVPDALDRRMTAIAVHQAAEESEVEDGVYVGDPESSWLYEEDVDYLRSLPQVRDIDFRYFSGAYIDGLTAKIGLTDFFDTKWHVNINHANDSYKNAIFIGTVEQAFTCPYDSVARYDLSAFGGEADVGEREQCAILKVESTIGLHPDFPLFSSDPESLYQGKVWVRIPAFGDETEPFFQVGKRYAVQGGYNPSVARAANVPENTPDCPSVEKNIGQGLYSCFAEDGALVCYQQIEEKMIRDVAWELHGNILKPVGDGTMLNALLSRENRIPVAVEWNGTVEELRADTEWGQIAREYEAALHSFPVLGTDHLESMYSFVKNEAVITEGRTFTQKEYETGAKVLILDEGVAKNAGLSVGDTVTLTQFQAAVGGPEGNWSVQNDMHATFDQSNNPILGTNVFYHGLPDGEAETFTIVGLYRIENEWKEAICSFTPNTVFMPRKAQTEKAYGGPSKQNGTIQRTGTGMDGQEVVFEEQLIEPGAVCGVYFSVILKNGETESFQKQLKDDSEYIEREYHGIKLVECKGLGNHKWLFFDQGYDAIKDNVGVVIASAGKLSALMAAGAALLFLMYMLLYQGTERKTIGIMRSLGATTKAARRYLFTSGLLLASVGIALGTVLSVVLSKIISAKLYEITLTQETAQFREMLTESSVPPWVYAALAAAAIAIAALALWIQAALIAKKHPRKLMGK